jgi:hypothetical protein
VLIQRVRRGAPVSQKVSVHGPFSFRFVLQPLMGLINATRDGIVNARQGRSPYFWSVVFTPGSARKSEEE